MTLNTIYKPDPHPLKFSEVRIENTNRCGYRCFFCPREKQTRALGTMPLEDFQLVLDRVGEHQGLVDLHGFGEPLLDQKLGDKLHLLISRWPKAEPRIYSTLGVTVQPGFFYRLIENGLRHIEVSFYGFDAESYHEAHGANRYAQAVENLKELCSANRRLQGRLNVVARAFPIHDVIKQPGQTDERMTKFIAWLDSLGVKTIRERDLHNYANGRSYNQPRKDTPCSVVWGYRRRVLQITWDLHVIPCCFDFNAEMKLGSLRDQTLSEIFLGASYTSFVQAHLEENLDDYPVCKPCDRCHRP
jgi:radical SAM family protein/iron-sulfur cluster protein